MLNLVPCRKLGLTMTFLGDLAVIVSVERGSIADEEVNKIKFLKFSIFFVYRQSNQGT